MLAEISKEASVAFSGDLTNGAYNSFTWQHHQESQTNHGIRQKSRPGEIGILPRNHFIEIGDRLADLSADSASKEIAKWGEFM